MSGGLSLPLEDWLKRYAALVTETFGTRVWFLGLQGSRARGEGSAASDLDTVLILDTVSVQDLTRYGALLDTLPDREKVCGFVSGREELLAWEPAELFQFCHDTRPLHGSLDAVLARVTREDVRRALRLGAGQAYHLCAHNLVNERSLAMLQEACKSAFFALRALAYLQTGHYFSTLAALGPQLEAPDQTFLDAGAPLLTAQNLAPEQLLVLSQQLLERSSDWLRRAAYA